MHRYRISPQGSTLEVETFKEGLLSKVAHDLRIAATDFEGEVTWADDRFTVRLAVSASGLHVLGAVKSGALSEMSDKDKREIEDTIRSPRILDARLYPTIQFAAEGTGALSGEQDVAGSLSLAGPTRPVRVRVRVSGTPEAPRVEGAVRLLQSTWGLKPYSALLGTLRVQDEVRVRWSLALAPVL